MLKYQRLHCRSISNREISLCVRRADGLELNEFDVETIGKVAMTSFDLSPTDRAMARLKELEQKVEPTKRKIWADRTFIYVMRKCSLEKLHGLRLDPYTFVYFDRSGIRVEVVAYEELLCPSEMNLHLSTLI